MSAALQLGIALELRTRTTMCDIQGLTTVASNKPLHTYPLQMVAQTTCLAWLSTTARTSQCASSWQRTHRGAPWQALVR